MKTLTKYAGILFVMAAMALPAHATEKQGLMREQVKTALNDMVREVKAAESPAEKREVLTRFLDKAERGTGILENLPFLSQEKHAALDMLQGKISGYAAELHGTASTGTGVADKDLNAFASFMQQDLEQPESSWSSGGIYLSTGAVIIILLILILIT